MVGAALQTVNKDYTDCVSPIITDPLKPENMQAIIRTVVGSDEEARKVIEETKSEEVKKAVAGNTNAAFDDGAFGLPWYTGKCEATSLCIVTAR